MCKLMEDYAEKRAREAAEVAAKKAEAAAKKAAKKAAEKAAKKAAAEKSVSVAFNLWNSGMRDLEQIASLTELPLDEVKKLFEGKTA